MEHLMPRKDEEPMGGPKDIQRRLSESGLDKVNADLLGLPENVTRVQAAVGLKLSGTSYSDIARVLEYSSPTHARTAVERALALTADQPEEIARLRVIQMRRYERLLQSVMSKAVDPSDHEHLAYNARAAALVDRISVLMGVNSPQQINITPNDEYIQAYVARITQLANADREAEEAEIEDAEIVED